MLRFALQRLLLALAVALTLSVAAFVLLNAAVDPAAALAGADASMEQIEVLRRQYGLDRPLAVQYFAWLGDLSHGEFGESWYWGQPVRDLLLEHAPVTLLLAALALLVTIAVAVPLGIVAALRPGGRADLASTTLAVALQATPGFWLGLLLIIVFALQLRVLPVSGDETFAHFVLPAVVLGLGSVPHVMRMTRAGLIDALAADYARTARAKGLAPMRVVVRHALPNALLPVVAVLAVQLAQKLGGSVVTESVFALNGLGRLALESILAADVPMVQMLVFVFGITCVVLNFLADLLNAWLDPRIRVG